MTHRRSAPGLGSSSRGFESHRPDQLPQNHEGICGLNENDSPETAWGISGEKSESVEYFDANWRICTITQKCWIWIGRRSRNGYGLINIDGRSKFAHRVSYELRRGSIPPGLVIDHLCRTRHCVNPWHMECVTGAENVRRGLPSPLAGLVRGAQQRAKTHCPAGHPYSADNTYYRPGTSSRPKGGRHCRICKMRKAYESYVRRKTKP